MTAPDIDGVADTATSPVLPRPLAMRIRQAAVGQLTLRDGHGKTQHFRGDKPGPHAEVLLHRRRAIRRMMLGGDIGLLEAYMDGDWDTPDLAAMLTWGVRNEQALGAALQASFVLRQLNRLLHRRRTNTRRGSRRNIAAHYDLGNAFYRLWLDPSMTYSCGIYPQAHTTLAQAQHEKYEHMLDLLKLEPGHHLLEIGSGWGGFAIHAAQRTGCRVTSITLSREQLAEAQARAQAAGVADRVQFVYRDYRDEVGEYDRIVSIEMFEAVGEPFWGTYFSQLRRCLRPGGLAALQVITIDEASFPAYRQGTDFIQRYIFPGGMLPAPGVFAEAAAAAGLHTEARHFYGPHYDRTLGDWDRAIVAHTEALTALGLGDRFQRMWRAYLAYCQAGFRTGRLDLMQTLLTAA